MPPLVPAVRHGLRPAIGFQHVTYATTTHGPMDYADAAAFNAAWAEILSHPNANAAAVDADGSEVVLLIEALTTPLDVAVDAYRERTFGGFTPGARYRVSLALEKLSGYQAAAASYAVAEVQGVRLGAGQAVGARFTVGASVLADAAGEITIRLGGFGMYAVFNLTVTLYALTITELTGTAAPALLTFALPLDSPLVSPRLSDGSALRIRRGGEQDAWRHAVRHRLRGEARAIPRETGLTKDGWEASGWESAGGWLDFFAAAWAKQTLDFYPDVHDLGTSFPVTLLAPGPFGGDDAPFYELEPDGTRRVLLEFEAADPITGY